MGFAARFVAVFAIAEIHFRHVARRSQRASALFASAARHLIASVRS
jgi:hypothetical protein